MTYEEIIKDLKNKIYKPVYLLQGDEPYFIDKIAEFAENNILNEAERSFNQTIIYGKDVDAKTLIDICMRYPMMSNYQVVILKEAQNWRDLDALEKYLLNPVASTIFIICYKGKKVDKRKKAWKEVAAKQIVFDSIALYENQLPAFIQQKVKEQQHKIEDKAAQLLVEYLGNDLSKIENEIEKLAINVAKTEMISTKHVEQFIGISREYNIFEFQNAISNKNAVKAYRIVDYFSKNTKEFHPIMIMSSLNSFFSKALLYQSFNNGERAKKEMFLNYYQDIDMKSYAKNYSILKTEKIFDVLLEYDLKIKGVGYANTDKELLLKEMLYKVLNA